MDNGCRVRDFVDTKVFSRPACTPAHASFVVQAKTCGAGRNINSLAS